MVTKKLSEGHPSVVDVIQDDSVSGVVNTITGGRSALRDGFYIRRAAAEARVPCFTSLDTLRVALEALAYTGKMFNVQPLGNYRRRPARTG
jgi:carbamoyl-phosphate synthase large subunit